MLMLQKHERMVVTNNSANILLECENQGRGTPA